jgi:AAA family ATPase
LSFLSNDEVSGGFSGAELIAACKDAAWRALEEDDEASNPSSQMPKIRMEHMLKAINGMQRQITPEMIEYYESFSKSHS